MNRKGILALALLPGVLLLGCASNQVSKHLLVGTERVVELYVPECDG
jgi:hypothetical protein